VAGRAQAYIYQVNTAMSSPFRARMSALSGRNDEAGLHDLLFRGTRWVSLLSFTLCGALWVHADRFMYAWMGPEYGTSGLVLRILLPGLALEMAQLVLFNGLYAIGRHSWLSVITVVEAIAIVACGLLLVRDHGLAGVAMGVTIPVAINKLTWQPIYGCRALGVGFWEWIRRGMLRPGLVTLICAPLAYGFEQVWSARSLAGILAQILLSIIPFAVVGWHVALDRTDRAAVLTTLRRVRRLALRAA
jgi:O-antigen/teichoic acid export membrane protein